MKEAMSASMICLVFALSGCDKPPAAFVEQDSTSAPAYAAPAGNLPDAFAAASATASPEEIQHLKLAAKKSPESGVVLAVVSGDLVSVLSSANGAASAQTYRFSNGTVNQSWTIGQAGMRIGGQITSDPVAEATEWLSREILIGFIGKAFNEGDPESAVSAAFAPDVIHHGATEIKGADALAAYLASPEGKRGAHDVKAILVQNDLAVTVSLVIAGSDPQTMTRSMAYDLYRFREGKIVEHWEIKQAAG